MDQAGRAIDHLVLPVPSLALARERLGGLGFTVAPDGVHPFGTRNACVYFADGTFLEPLAVDDAARYGEALADGNVFVARDRLFREKAGDDGFSAIAFATKDAAADHAAFVRAGMSAGGMLSFSRPFVAADGQAGAASFRLAFAAGGRDPALFFFSCERVGRPAVDRSALERHGNGAAGLAAVLAVSDDPAGAARAIAEVCGAAPHRRADGGFDLPLAKGRIAVLDRDGWARLCGIPAPPGAGTRLAGIAVRMSDPDRARRLAAEGGAGRATGEGILAWPGPGPAIFLAAREDSAEGFTRSGRK